MRRFRSLLKLLVAVRYWKVCLLDSSYLQFFGDDFLRLLLLRYVFCDVVLHLHRAFRGRQYRPRCQPPLPEAELLEHPSLQHLVLDLAAHLEVRTHFMDNHEIDWSRASSSWPCVGFSDIWRSSSRQTHEDRLAASRRKAPVQFLLLIAFAAVFMVTNAHFLWNIMEALRFFWTLYIVRDGFLKCKICPVLTHQVVIRKSAKHKSITNVTNTFSCVVTSSWFKLSYFWTPFMDLGKLSTVILLI